MRRDIVALSCGILLLSGAACGREGRTGEAGGEVQLAVSGQAAVADEASQKSVARIAADSKDHTTLVAALKAVNYVDPLANPGPFTVFAPTNAAFDKLPAGTMDTLLRPENAAKLRTILLHHVTTSAYEASDLADGMTLQMVDGTPVTIRRTADGLFVGDAKVLASIRASNGVVHVVDGVLLPPGK